MNGVSSGKIKSGSRNFGGVKKTTFFGATYNKQQESWSQLRNSGVSNGKNGKQ